MKREKLTGWDRIIDSRPFGLMALGWFFLVAIAIIGALGMILIGILTTFYKQIGFLILVAIAIPIVVGATLLKMENVIMKKKRVKAK